ncbi:MAG: sulfotransferase [Bauldia sp.]|nr:sulfotransferase [Bauldia sp.]
MGYGLVIVTGCMRSGTTLLHRTISTSPDTGPMLAPARYITDQFDAYRRYARKERFFVDDYFADLEAFRAHLRHTVQRILDAAWDKSGRPHTLVIKSVDFGYSLLLVSETLPEARFVVSVREPKDTVTSILKVSDRQRQDGVAAGPGGWGRNIKRAGKVYVASYLPVLRAIRFRRELAERVHFMKYEDLVSAPSATMAAVWRHCRIAPGSGNLEELARKSDPERDETAARNLASSKHWRAYLTELTSKAISRSSVGSHATALSASEAAAIDWRCRSIRRRFGYA